MKKLTAKQYAQALLGAYEDSTATQRPTVVKQFIQLLVRRRAMKLMPRILNHVQQLQDTADGITRVQAWTAEPTDTKRLTSALKTQLGKVKIETHTDPNLLGGLRLQIGDTLIDGTLRHRLKTLQTQLRTR